MRDLSPWAARVNREQDAADGVEIAQRALRHFADGREGEALAALNDSTHAQAVWAAAYLLSAVKEAVEARFAKPAQVRQFIHQATRDPGDVLMTRVGVFLDESQRDGDRRG